MENVDGSEMSYEFLAGQIRTLLAKSRGPLKARAIVEFLARRGINTDKTSVNHCLYITMSGHVQHDEEKQWSLTENQGDLDARKAKGSGLGETKATGSSLEKLDELSRNIIRVLHGSEEAVPTPVVTTRLSELNLTATLPAVAAQLYDLMEEGHVARGRHGRWRLDDEFLESDVLKGGLLSDEVSEPQEGVKEISAGNKDEQPAHENRSAGNEKGAVSQRPLKHSEHQVVGILEEAEKPLTVGEIAFRHFENYPTVSKSEAKKAAERIAFLQQRNRVRQDGGRRWSLVEPASGQDEKQQTHDHNKKEGLQGARKRRVVENRGSAIKDDAEGESSDDVDESERSDLQADEAENLVFEVLASAPSALSGSHIASRIQDAGASVDRQAVVAHLYRLRDEGRVLVDRYFKWHVAQGERREHASNQRSVSSADQEPVDIQEAANEEATSSAMSPSGQLGHVSADLELAKQIATVLELSPRPMPTQKLINLLTQMGMKRANENADRLLRGTLQPYVREEKAGWVLRNRTQSESRSQEDSATIERGTSRNLDSSQTQPTSSTPHTDLLAAHMQMDSLNYSFDEATLDAIAFFDAVREGASTTRLRLNSEHPAFEFLRVALEVGTAKGDSRPPHRLLRKAQRALRLLLVGWVRYEESLSGPRRHKAQEAKSDWSRSIRSIVERHRESDHEQDEQLPNNTAQVGRSQ